MKPKKRQKLCYNCEGDVDLEVIVCPFCAADLREEKPELQRSAYNPAASVKKLETPKAFYSSETSKEASPNDSLEMEDPQEEVVALSEEDSSEAKSIVAPTLLFALGVQLFLFGALMFLFENKGALILKWDARMWFIYIFASIPFLLFGYRSLSKV